MNVVSGLVAVLTVGSLLLGVRPTLAASTDAQAPAGGQSAGASGTSESKAAPAEQPAKTGEAGQTANEKKSTANRVVRGEVTAVETAAKTLTVKTMRRKQAATVGVDVPDMAKITEGKAAKTLADVKVGDRVWMTYGRTSGKLVADEIHILPPHKAAAKKTS